MTAHDEADFLPLSGIQHYAFCPRQWGLIHVERAWSENHLTAEGRVMHERTHDGTDERRGELLITRAMPVVSRTLCIRGECDVVEFHADEGGIALHGRHGAYRPVPVEYKRGQPKEHDADALQVCAQALCLEEMLVCNIPEGFLFYGETRRRVKVDFDEALRRRVVELIGEMRGHYERGYTPKARPAKRCAACSLNDLCLPKLARRASAAAYIESRLQEGDE